MPNNSTPPCTLITIKRGYYHLLLQYRSQQSFVFPRVITRIWSATVDSLWSLSLSKNNIILGYSLMKSLTITTFICTVWVCEWTYGVTMQMRPLRQQYLNSLHWFYLFLDSSLAIWKLGLIRDCWLSCLFPRVINVSLCTAAPSPQTKFLFLIVFEGRGRLYTG